MKDEREARLKEALEQRWREPGGAEWEHQIGTAELDIQDSTRRRERVAKEIQGYERQVKESGPGGANKPAQILATEEKIDGAKKALEHTGQKIIDVELEVPASRIIPIQRAAPPLAKDRTQQTKIAGAGGPGIFVLALLGVSSFYFRARKICLPDEVAHGLGLHVLGTVPAMPAASKKQNTHTSDAPTHCLTQ